MVIHPIQTSNYSPKTRTFRSRNYSELPNNARHMYQTQTRSIHDTYTRVENNSCYDIDKLYKSEKYK